MPKQIAKSSVQAPANDFYAELRKRQQEFGVLDTASTRPTPVNGSVHGSVIDTVVSPLVGAPPKLPPRELPQAKTNPAPTQKPVPQRPLPSLPPPRPVSIGGLTPDPSPRAVAVAKAVNKALEDPVMGPHQRLRMYGQFYNLSATEQLHVIIQLQDPEFLRRLVTGQFEMNLLAPGYSAIARNAYAAVDTQKAAQVRLARLSS